ncbi:MAG: radical SAM protein [Candidatus Aenigmatarchaeota archaeon]
MARVFLSPIYGDKKTQTFDCLTPNPGPAMLAASLLKEGQTVRIYDPNLPRNSMKGLETCIDGYDPDLLALSVYQNGFFDTIDLAKRVKKKHPEIKIAAGGPQITTWDSYVYNVTDAFDVLGIGEGEYTITGLADWADGGKLGEVPGIIYKEGGEIRRNPPKVFTNLDELPSPAWQLFELDKYLPMFPLELGRSCPWAKCAFCVHGKLSGKRRERSPKISVDEMERDIKEYGMTNFRITDSSPTHRTLEGFSDEILNRKLKEKYDVKWCTLVRAKETDFPLSKKMHAAGCVAEFIGAESGDDQMLRRMNKGETADENRKAIMAAKDAGVKASVSTIIGFPGETEESIQKTVNLIYETMPDSVMIYPLGVMPSTPLSGNPEKYGIKLHEDWKEKFMKTSVKLIGGRMKVPHYFDYADGKPNTYYGKKVGKLLMKNAKALVRKGVLIQVPEHLFLFAEMLEKEKAGRLINNPEAAYESKIKNAWTTVKKKAVKAMGKPDFPYEMKMMNGFHSWLRNGYAEGVEEIVGMMWENSRARAGGKAKAL